MAGQFASEDRDHIFDVKKTKKKTPPGPTVNEGQ